MVLAQLTPRRFRACLPLIFAVCLVLVASIPAVAGDSERPVQASIFVSRTEASPTENVSFWIWVEPLKEKARKLVITEATLDGFDVTSTTIPDSCLESRRTWVCIQDDLRPFSIEVQAVAKAGTEGRDVVYGASVALWKTGEGYGNASGGQVRLANVPTSLVVLPMRPQAPLSPLPALVVVAVLVFVLRSLFLPAGPIVPALRRPSGPAEVFLLHRSGILLHHVTPIQSAGLDSDIVGGMLSAIRMFVETTMDPSTGPLQEPRFRGCRGGTHTASSPGLHRASRVGATLRWSTESTSWEPIKIRPPAARLSSPARSLDTRSAWKSSATQSRSCTSGKAATA